MKRSLHIFFFLMLLVMVVKGQNLQTLDHALSIHKSFIKKELPASKAAVIDTVFFSIARLSNPDSAKYLGLYTGSASSLGQYFSCPQSITLTGVNFWAISYPQALVACTVSVFYAGADSLPTGTALATTTIMVDSAFNNGLISNVTFPTPITLNLPYVITLSNALGSTSGIYLLTTNYKTNDGLGQSLACAQMGTWFHASELTVEGYAYDADFLIHPIINYSLADPAIIKNPLCLNVNNSTVSFDLNVSGLYTDIMYNYKAFSGSPSNSFQWDFGDGGPIIYALNNFHVYATPDLYDISLKYYFEAWTYTTPLDSLVDQIGICSTIDEYAGNLIDIYPNPADNFITIDNAVGFKVELINILGQTLVTKEITGLSEKMQFDHLPSGSYLLKFTSARESFSRQIVLE